MDSYYKLPFAETANNIENQADFLLADDNSYKKSQEISENLYTEAKPAIKTAMERCEQDFNNFTSNNEFKQLNVKKAFTYAKKYYKTTISAIDVLHQTQETTSPIIESSLSIIKSTNKQINDIDDKVNKTLSDNIDKLKKSISELQEKIDKTLQPEIDEGEEKLNEINIEVAAKKEALASMTFANAAASPTETGVRASYIKTASEYASAVAKLEAQKLWLSAKTEAINLIKNNILNLIKTPLSPEFANNIITSIVDTPTLNTMETTINTNFELLETTINTFVELTNKTENLVQNCVFYIKEVYKEMK